MPRRPGDTVDHVEERRLARARASALRRMFDKPQEITVELWLSAYRELFPDERSASTVEKQGHYLRGFSRVYGRRKMWEITALHAQAWALKHPHEVRYLRHAWGKAAAMGVAPVNVWRVVEMPLRTQPKPRPPTELELAAALAACRSQPERGVGSRLAAWWWLEFARMIEVAAYTGAREMGLIGLRLEDVDLPGRRMRLTEKGGKTRTVALPAVAHAALSAQLAESRRGPVRIRPAVWRDHLGEALTPDRVQRSWRHVRGDFPFGFHTLRHYCATWLAGQGVSELAIAVQFGHTDSEGRPYARLVQSVYNHPDPAPALAEVEAL